MSTIYGFEVAMNNVLRMKINKTQGDMVKLYLTRKIPVTREKGGNISQSAVGRTPDGSQHSHEHSHSPCMA